MNTLLHFHFQGSLISSEAEQTETVRRSLDPLLAWMEMHPGLRFAVSISGFLLENLPAETKKKITALAASQLEVLHAPFFDAALSTLSLEEQIHQLEFSRDFWNSCNVPLPKAAFLEHGASLDIAALRDRFDLNLLVCPANALVNPQAPRLLTAETANGILNVLACLYEPLDLSLYKPGAKTLSVKFGAAQNFNARGFLISGAKLLPERLNPFEMRNAFLEIFPELRGEKVGVTGAFTGLADSGECPADDFPDEAAMLAEFKLASRPEGGAAEHTFLSRIAELRSDLVPLADFITTQPKEATNLVRLAAARKFSGRVLSAECLLHTTELYPRHKFRRSASEAIISAQVEIDTIRHPEVDPIHGWIVHELKKDGADGLEEVVADSQLKRLYFKAGHGGALAEFDYKPRKLDLSCTFDAEGRNHSFVDSLVKIDPGKLGEKSLPEFLKLAASSADGRAEPLVTRQTLDLFGLRLVRGLECRSLGAALDYKTSLVKHFTVKAGIGAHMNNATTGFNFEFWLEGDIAPPENVYLMSQFCFCLPSGNPDAISIRPLSAVGGAATFTYELAHPQFVPGNAVEGGLYGTRLIDGIESFVMDLRSSKPLNALVAFPLENNGSGECGGIAVLYFTEARRIFGDDKSNTIFLSIQ